MPLVSFSYYFGRLPCINGGILKLQLAHSPHCSVDFFLSYCMYVTCVLAFTEESLLTIEPASRNRGGCLDVAEQEPIQNFNIVRQVDEELNSLCAHVDDLVLNLGKELINEIQAEENFPPDYLKNVIEKVASIKVRYDTSKAKVDKIQAEMEYMDYYRNFEKQLETLAVILDDCEAWLERVTEAIHSDAAFDKSEVIDQGRFS